MFENVSKKDKKYILLTRHVNKLVLLRVPRIRYLIGSGIPNQVDGAVLAPTKVSSWPKSSLFQWLNFKWLHNFTIQGSGTVDGMGFNWWARSRFDNNKVGSLNLH